VKQKPDVVDAHLHCSWVAWATSDGILPLSRLLYKDTNLNVLIAVNSDGIPPLSRLLFKLRVMSVVNAANS
jgi:hypothetical protein